LLKPGVEIGTIINEETTIMDIFDLMGALMAFTALARLIWA
jgi:hypothetical protein